MSDEFGTDPEKMLDWDKKLGDQSDYVKKAIEPLLTWEWAYTKECIDNGQYYMNEYTKQKWETKNKEDPNFVKEHILKEFSVGDLYDRLGGNDDDLIAVNKLKTLGIEGERHGGKVNHVYDDDYLKSIDRELYYKEQQKENNMSEKFNWRNVSEGISLEDDYSNFNYLKTSFGITEINHDPYYFLVGYSDDSHKNVNISFFNNPSDIINGKLRFHFEFKGDIDTAKNIVENTLEYFENNDLKASKNGLIHDVKEQLNIQIAKQQSPEQKIQTAQKTGYVQGVCESVLAFNTDENRKIMSEAAMSLLSKKILSEMNVTKDMAQKFANPETYKALEQCVFAPKQEQRLEQTQSQGIKR